MWTELQVLDADGQDLQQEPSRSILGPERNQRNNAPRGNLHAQWPLHSVLSNSTLTPQQVRRKLDQAGLAVFRTPGEYLDPGAIQDPQAVW